MGQFTYLFPALVFFVVFFVTGKDFLLATASIMIVVSFQVIFEKLKKGEVEKSDVRKRLRVYELSKKSQKSHKSQKSQKLQKSHKSQRFLKES